MKIAFSHVLDQTPSASSTSSPSPLKLLQPASQPLAYSARRRCSRTKCDRRGGGAGRRISGAAAPARGVIRVLRRQPGATRGAGPDLALPCSGEQTHLHAVPVHATEERKEVSSRSPGGRGASGLRESSPAHVEARQRSEQSGRRRSGGARGCRRGDGGAVLGLGAQKPSRAGVPRSQRGSRCR